MHFDQAVVILDNAIDNRETETGALTNSFGCEKGLEEPGANAVRHSRSGVDDFDADILAWLSAGVVDRGTVHQRCSQNELAALGHRVAGIDAKIEQGLGDLIRIGHDHRQLGAQLQRYVDGFWQRLFEQIDEAGNQLIDTAGDQARFGLARQRQ